MTDINAYSDQKLLKALSSPSASCPLHARVINSLFSQEKYKLSSPYLHLYDQIFFLMVCMQIRPFLES